MTRRRRKLLLDDIDLEILRILYEDGREPLVSIGEKVNLKHPSVIARIRRLIDNNLMRVQANINTKKFGFQLGIIMMDVSDPEKIVEISKALKNCWRVIMILHITGDYNLMVLFIAPNPRLVSSFIDRNLRALPYVRKINFIIGEIYHPDFLPMRIARPEECIEKCRECIFRIKLKLCPGCVEIMKAMKKVE